MSTTIFNPTKLVRPTTLEEAISLLESLRSSARLVAGNTTLYELVRQGALSDVDCLVGMECLGLDYIRIDNSSKKTLCIGAMTRFIDMARSPLISGDNAFNALCEAASKITPLQIRNTGTIGGSLCCGIPFYDMPTAVMALDGDVHILSAQGKRNVRIDNLFHDYFVTDISPNELVVEVCFELTPESFKSASSFVKLGRTAIDFAVVNVATYLSTDRNSGKVTKARIALGGVANTVIRAIEAENELIGKLVLKDEGIDLALIQEIANVAAANIEPKPSVHASTKYKKRIIPFLVRDSLVQTSTNLKQPKT